MNFRIRVVINDKLPHGSNPWQRVERFVIYKEADGYLGVGIDHVRLNLLYELKSVFFHIGEGSENHHQ